MSFPFGGERWFPITLWPPFYSMALALPGVVGVDPVISARWLNAGLLGANTALVALLLRRALGKSFWIPMAGAVLFLGNQDTLSTHSWAWSDPLSMFLGFYGLLVLDGYLESGRRMKLIASALLVGLSAYSRYAGVAFVLAALIAIALVPLGSRGLKAKLVDLASFAGVAGLPLLGWSLRNFLTIGYLGGDPATLQAIPSRDWQALYHIVSLWFLPGRITEPIRGLIMAAVGAAFLVLTPFAVATPPPSAEKTTRNRSRLGRTLLIFPFVYFVIIIGTRLLLRPFNIRDARYYLPLYLAFVVIWLIDLDWLYGKVMSALARVRLTGRAWGKLLIDGSLAAAFVIVVAFHAVHAFKGSRESYSEGTGYSNTSWRTSQLLDYIRDLPTEDPVLSNVYDAIYTLTGREVYPLPNDDELRGTVTGLSSAEAWEQMTALLRADGARLAVFREATRRGMVSEEQIVKEIPVCPVVVFPEGRVYVWCGPK